MSLKEHVDLMIMIPRFIIVFKQNFKTSQDIFNKVEIQHKHARRKTNTLKHINIINTLYFHYDHPLVMCI